MAQFALADELGDYLGRDLEPNEVPQADLLLQLASAAIQSEAHQSLEYVEDDTVVLRGTYDGQLWLPERPVHDVGDIVIRNGSGLPTALDITATQFTWDRLGFLRRGPWIGGGVETNADVPWGGWGGPMSTVVVTYSHGYEVIPDAIKGITLAAAGRTLQGSALVASNPTGLETESEAIDGYSHTVTYRSNASTAATLNTVVLSPDELRVARRYRNAIH